MIHAQKEYDKRLKKYHKQLQQLTHKINLLSNLRLLVALITIGAAVWVYNIKDYKISVAIFLAGLIVFIILVIMHEHIHVQKNKARLLSKINSDSIKRTQGEWKEFDDNGEAFVDENHSFSWDLDLFGKDSLFKWINTAGTYLGKQQLKKLLIMPEKNCEDIKNRQAAIKELALKLDWRQHFQAAAITEKDKIKNPNDLFAWSSQQNYIYQKRWLVLLVKTLPFLTLIVILLSFLVKGISYYMILIPLLIQIGMLIMRYKDLHRLLSVVDNYRNDIKKYEEMIKQLENEEFNSHYIQTLKKRMQSEQNETALQQIHKLDKIIDKISLRHTQFYIIFNIFTLWGYRCVIALEKWKQRYNTYLIKWVECLGKMEALSSLAVIAFEQPQWVMPEIVSERKIYAQQIGHPLILEDERVCNDICFGEDENVLLITGSNMSGKSTFLRTLGINLVLAYAGAPVCAQQFTCSILEIYTSMRVKDDIAQKVSSFYAEILRIKVIIEAVSSKRVFFLLDEIFRGTNSRDRHIGAKILIKKLSAANALGMVSTHDLELSELSDDKEAKVRNCHFSEHYKDGEIYFDYCLYPGVSTTINALYLMRQVGIEIDKIH